MFSTNPELCLFLSAERTKERQEVLTLFPPSDSVFYTKGHAKYKGAAIDHCYCKSSYRASGTLRLPIYSLELTAAGQKVTGSERVSRPLL